MNEYDGNQISSVLDDAALISQNDSMDYPGTNREMKFGYSDWGALVRDGSRGITDISFDRFGNPLKISYSDGSCTENVYSAAAEKLKTVHSTAVPGSTVTAKSTIEYRGNVIYRDGKVDMVLFPGGYATVNGTAVTFHYYTQDYLGNNRAVINGSTGAIEQMTAYYPFGAVIADLGTNPTTGQPYKFGGKELVTANGLNEYDFGARQYYPAVLGFTRIDPLREDSYPLSPYLYCGNNPVNAIDPDGRYPIYDTNGNFLGVDEMGLQGNPIVKDACNFENGMSHDTATGYACDPKNKEATDKIKKHHSSLPNRPDYDGIVTMEEGIAWAKAHQKALENPTPDNMLYIDTSKLDFGPLSVNDFKSVGFGEPQNLYENAFSTLNRARNNSRYRDTVYALGRCNIKLLNRSTRNVTVVNDNATDYDWNGGGSVMRKLSIFVNNLWFSIDPKIHGFKTFYYGVGKLNQ